MRKRRTHQHIIAVLGFNYTERQVLKAGFILNRLFPDYGYDGSMVTFDTNGELEPGNIFIQVKATDKLVKSSVQKLNVIANLIRKENVNEAILQLEFCKRSVSKQLQNILKSAIANSQNNHGLDIDKLYVKEVLIGKSLTLKRSMVRARGRINRIIKPFSKVTIIVEERG